MKRFCVFRRQRCVVVVVEFFTSHLLLGRRAVIIGPVKLNEAFEWPLILPKDVVVCFVGFALFRGACLQNARDYVFPIARVSAVNFPHATRI